MDKHRQYARLSGLRKGFVLGRAQRQSNTLRCVLAAALAVLTPLVISWRSRFVLQLPCWMGIPTAGTRTNSERPTVVTTYSYVIRAHSSRLPQRWLLDLRPQQCHRSWFSASSCAIRSSRPAPVSWTPSEANVAESTVPDACCSTPKACTSALRKPTASVCKRWRRSGDGHALQSA